MAVTEAQKRASEKYLSKLDEIRIRMPKGKKDTIKAYTNRHGESINGFVNRIIDEAIKRDGVQGGITVKFEWDDEKEKINITKHGISFSLAVQVFLDENRIEVFDERHSINEDRYITIGKVRERMLIITLVYTERGNIIRVISARQATKKERSLYYDSIV